MVLCAWILALGLLQAGAQEQRIEAKHYAARGVVLKVDRAAGTVFVSTDAIPGFMEPMAMSYPVKDAKELDGLTAGATIDFDLVVTPETSFVQDIKARAFRSVEQDPLTASRLKLLDRIDSSAATVKQIATGEAVPDFTLIDQATQTVKLSDFSGKVVVISFMYTRCALPTYCFRLSNNLARLQKRFHEALGRDLILLSVTFDPAHDQVPQLAAYAKIWHADPATWHMLTGPAEQVQTVCREFGVSAYPDEGLMIHSLHTVIIDRDGKLAANLEGNEFSAVQLGDLVETVMKR
jgi:protein SCO1